MKIDKNKNILFFCLLLLSVFCVTTSTKAQEVKPGNVSNTVELWLSNPDTTYKTTAGSVHTWVNQANPAKSFSDTVTISGSVAGPSPVLNTTTKIMNFYPSLYFDGASLNSRATKLTGRDLLQEGKSYYVFYVSEIDANNIVGVLLGPHLRTYSSTDNDFNYVGWSSGRHVFATHTTNYYLTGNGKLYGVTAVMRPNDTSTPQRAYLNGVENLFEPRAMGMPAGNSLAFIGSQAINTNPFKGNVQEIIILSSSSTGRSMTSVDFSKISSYLALKYGITFEGTDYLNSDGRSVWSKTLNQVYNKNIFGLVRDDLNGHLHQKQATSYDASHLIAYISPNNNADPLPSLNYENTAAISVDKTYVLFGSNGESGKLFYDPAQTGNQHLFPKPFNHRSKEVWKAQLSHNGNPLDEYTLNFKVPDPTATHLIVSSESNFVLNLITAYELVDGVAQNITIRNGQYISYASYIEAPGGVAVNLELWLKADAIGQIHGSPVNPWLDASGKGRNFTNGSNVNDLIPTLDTINRMNFEPSLLFPSGGTNDNRRKLISNVFVESGKSYHTFYVSRSNPPGTGNQFGTVLAFNASDYNIVGWNRNSSNLMRPFFNTDANTYYHQGNAKNYGIVMVSRPNTTLLQRVYLNGEMNSANARVMAIGSAKTVIGNSGEGNENPFYGNIQEIIVLSGPAGHYLSDAEIAKINTYLALKYGISLVSGNYVNSSGFDIWIRDNNIGYDKNIFGIGRDDNSHLYIKQATSYDDSKLTVYLNSLEILNSENTGTFANNNTFLILGSNGLNGIGAYAQAAGTTYENSYSLTSKVDYRFNETFKAQLSGATSITVNLKVTEPNTELLFVSSSIRFAPGQTRAYPLTNGVATNVEIHNGDYIMYAFQPAPITATYTKEIWLKADDLTSSPVSPWSNAIVGSFNFTQGTVANRPSLNTNDGLMNYQPSVSFTAANQYLASPASFPISTAKSYYTFYVSEVTPEATIGTNQRVVLSLGGSTANNFNGWYNNNPSFTTENGTYAAQQPFVQEASSAKNFGIAAVIRPNTGGEQSIYFNGLWQQKAIGSMTNRTNMTAYIGSSTSSSANAFLGNVQEIILLTSDTKGPMDFTELQKINSYLAIKYGLTLDAGDYILSDDDETVVWSRTAAVDNVGVRYDKNIFGIGRDDATNLFQRQSRAYNPTYDAPFTVFKGSTVTNLNRNNDATGTDMPDGSFVMFSANEELHTVKPMTTEMPAATYRNLNALPESMNYTTAIYQVQKTGDGITNINIRKEIPYDAYLLVSNSPSFIPAQTDLYHFSIPTLYSIPIANGDYLSIVTKAKPAPGGVIDGLRLWLKPDLGNDYIHVSDSLTVNYWKSYTENNVEYEYYISGKNPSLPPHYRPHFREIDPIVNYHSSVIFKVRQRVLPLGTQSDLDQKERNNAVVEYLSTTGGVMSVPKPNNFTFYSLVNADLTELKDVMTGSYERAYLVGFGDRFTPYFTNGDSYKPNSKPALGMDKNSGRYLDPDVGNSGVNGEEDGGKKLFAYGSTSIVGHEVSAQNHYVQFEFDNYKERKTRPLSSPNALTGASFEMSGPGTLGAATYTNRSLNGQIGEVLAYERALAQDEKDAIYSYMGLKYGITIDLDKASENVNFDYFLSNRILVWPGTSSEIHKKYHYNVAALVRDDGAAYENKQSRSTGVDNALWMGLKNNDGTFSSFGQDMTAITWGHDSIPLTSKLVYTPEDDICGPIQDRMRRVWLVDNSTGRQLLDPDNPSLGYNYAPQEVTIRVGGTPGFPYQGAGYQVYMLVADSEADLFAGTAAFSYSDATNNWKEIIEGAYVRNAEGIGEHEFKFILDQKYTYITFGARVVPGGCEAFGFRGSKKLTFTNANWPSSTRLGPNYFNLGDGFIPSVEVVFSDGAVPYNNNYPAVNSFGLDEYRKGNARGVMLTKIDLDGKPAAASFEIADVDGRSGNFDELEIWGECGGDPSILFYPTLSYVTDASRSSYTILNNGTNGKARGNNIDVPGNDPRGRMSVRFDYPVDKIFVKHWTSGKKLTNVARDIHIGHITFTSPAPLPPVNDAGFSFTKEVPDTASLCEEVEYIYRIYNAECLPKEINFTDTLPAGMSWVSGSLSLPTGSTSSGTVINSYGDSLGLSIQKLIVPGTRTLVFSVRATFDESTNSGDYGERAEIKYRYIQENIEIDDSLKSCDRFLGCGIAGKTHAIGNPTDRNKRVETSITATRSCYGNSEIEFTIRVKSLIQFNNNVSLSINFNDTATLVNNNITIPSGMGGALYPIIPQAGSYLYENLTLAANTQYEIKFRLRMPNKALLPFKQIPLLDPLGNQLYDPDDGSPLFQNSDEFEDLMVGFSFSTNVDDICLQEVFSRAYGDVILPYCSGKEKIIINKNVTTRKR